MKENTGKFAFTYGGEAYQTWYKVVGDLQSGRRPLVTLHGGPGMSHHYMLPHSELVTLCNIPVIFYDQIGIGQSSHPAGKPKEFWTMDLFMDELDNLLINLGIADDFDLLGHSWGAMLAGHYAAVRHPNGLKHVVIANGGASMELWQAGTQQLLDRMPEDVRERIRKGEREGIRDTKEFQDAMKIFNSKHICNVDPWPQELLESFAAVDKDPTVYGTMIGPSEFNVEGTLRAWSIVDRVQDITAPTLLINARDDTAQDIGLIPFFLEVPRVKWVQLAHSSHIPFFEEKERYFEVVADFLTKV